MPTTLRIEVPRVYKPLLSPARYKGAYGGRGSGKSHFFAGQMVLQAILRPLRAVCVREFQRSLEQSVKRLLEDKIAQFGLGEQFRILNTHIESRNGGLIIFQGMQAHTAESIKSLEGYDVAWVEEAQALSQRSLDLLTAHHPPRGIGAVVLVESAQPYRPGRCVPPSRGSTGLAHRRS